MQLLLIIFISLILFTTKYIETYAYITNFEKECNITTTISCHISSDYRDCNEIHMSPNSCEDVDVTFRFRYCNLHRHNTITEVSGELEINHGKALHQPLHDRDLEPMHCKERSQVYSVSTCAQSFQAYITAEGRIDNEVQCQSDRNFAVIRPLFEATQ